MKDQRLRPVCIHRLLRGGLRPARTRRTTGLRRRARSGLPTSSPSREQSTASSPTACCHSATPAWCPRPSATATSSSPNPGSCTPSSRSSSSRWSSTSPAGANTMTHQNFSACAGRFARVFVGLGDGWVASTAAQPTAEHRRRTSSGCRGRAVHHPGVDLRRGHQGLQPARDRVSEQFHTSAEPIPPASPSHDQCGIPKPSGTSSAERW